MANDDNKLNRIADTSQLKASQMQERAGFAHWDNWRRLKIETFDEKYYDITSWERNKKYEFRL